MLFDVQVYQVGAWRVVSVVGDIDLATMPILHTRLRGEQGHVAVDLSGVQLLEPVTLGVLLAASLRCARSGTSFVVICPPGRPREILAGTRLDDILDVVDSADELPAP